MRRLIIVVAILATWSCQKESKNVRPVASAAKPVEIGDSTLIPLCKTTLDGFSSGDIDLLAQHLADNCVYAFNAGDSVTGKTAIADFWRARRKDVIDTVIYSKQIWLPVSVSASENAPTGETVLAWMQADAVYKTGRNMRQWIHFVYHFNNDRKIDYILQFIDRLPVDVAAETTLKVK